MKAGSLGRSPAALTHDEFILPAAKMTNDDRLEEADLGDGEGQFVECVLIKGPARLTLVRSDHPDFYFVEVGSGDLPQGWFGSRPREHRWLIGGNCTERAGRSQGGPRRVGMRRKAWRLCGIRNQCAESLAKTTSLRCHCVSPACVWLRLVSLGPGNVSLVEGLREVWFHVKRTWGVTGDAGSW